MIFTDIVNTRHRCVLPPTGRPNTLARCECGKAYLSMAAPVPTQGQYRPGSVVWTRISRRRVRKLLPAACQAVQEAGQ